MPEVWIPSLMRGLTDGQEQVQVPGQTIREVIENLEARFPGIKDRICDGDRVRPGLAVAIDGVVSNEGMRQKVAGESEVHFVTAISGGL
jgi:molybdopterin synthase sulfur carrier subunit